MNGKPYLEFREDGTFQVLHITDLQEGVHPKKDTLRLLTSGHGKTGSCHSDGRSVKRIFAGISASGKGKCSKYIAYFDRAYGKTLYSLCGYIWKS